MEVLKLAKNSVRTKNSSLIHCLKNILPLLILQRNKKIKISVYKRLLGKNVNREDIKELSNP